MIGPGDAPITRRQFAGVASLISVSCARVTPTPQGSSLCQVRPPTNIHPEPSHAWQISPMLRPSPLQKVHSRQSLNCVALWLIPRQSLSS
jgi:hypothetical protein